ncbi:SulP family inorganic anion transporter [Sphingobium lignivorans]|uniref:SulP family sulfate permease n=1 Tax=Sphingobium lignivorans TaxID=2735886 RepID=A0ABR6NA33_9SPHN|nr:SulP family inorganic anion transporter [Sphingobium lignivorans]MBB5984130.1 SulP family sulfate permease [Sphingobium lignivorans]
MKPSVAAPSFAELFTPKLVTVLREGYDARGLKADAVAGLTVAIVALPLSMAIAIASGVGPERGLYTAIIGGFIVSMLGGSRFQIGGPAGAFIVLIAATVARHGVDGLLIATFLSGLMLMAAGWLRLGTFVKFIPYPVTVGFTAGIGIIILASQLKDLMGLTLAGPEPGELLPKLQALGAALPTVNAAALGLALAAIAIILACRKWRPHWPAYLIAVVATALLATLVNLPVETIGSRFGEIPRGLPAPGLPDLSLSRVVELLPTALSFTLLGAIESLLSAVVADSMSGRRHRSNCELVAQGAANCASALFGGMCVTGTIARTATNVRAGARGPVSGMLHAVFLLVFMLVAAPLASYIPLAALAGLLATVAWNMVERDHIATLVRASRGDALVLAVTFLLVVLEDLSLGILVGFSLGTLIFLNRMAQAVEVETGSPLVETDRADDERTGGRSGYEPAPIADQDIALCRISGAFFFGAAGAVSAMLDRLDEHPRAYVINMADVPMLDSTGAATMEAFARKAAQRGAALYIAGARPAVRRALLSHGIRPPHVHYRANMKDAIEAARLAKVSGEEETLH